MVKRITLSSPPSGLFSTIIAARSYYGGVLAHQDRA
jgi:hypothetical protein